MDAKSSAGVLLSSPAAAQRCAEGAGLDSGSPAAAQSAMPSIALPAARRPPITFHQRRCSATPQLQSRISTSLTDVTLGQPADVKRQRAQSLIIRGARRQTAVLLLQSLAEFSYAATRKFGVSVASVRRRINGWCGGFPVQPAAEPDLAVALDLVSAHNISFWDALLCATSIRTGLSFLMTEDLQDGRSLHGLTIVNPFRRDNDALVDHILPP
jgi:predicted nucleic acid-binding protein